MKQNSSSMKRLARTRRTAAPENKPIDSSSTRTMESISSSLDTVMVSRENSRLITSNGSNTSSNGKLNSSSEISAGTLTGNVTPLFKMAGLGTVGSVLLRRTMSLFNVDSGHSRKQNSRRSSISELNVSLDMRSSSRRRSFVPNQQVRVRKRTKSSNILVCPMINCKTERAGLKTFDRVKKYEQNDKSRD
jgi:hypothetical protein